MRPARASTARPWPAEGPLRPGRTARPWPAEGPLRGPAAGGCRRPGGAGGPGIAGRPQCPGPPCRAVGQLSQSQCPALTRSLAAEPATGSALAATQAGSAIAEPEPQPGAGRGRGRRRRAALSPGPQD